MNIDKIHEMWAADCEIDNFDLEESSRKTPILHAKYLEIMTKETIMMKKYEADQKKLLKLKWLYYNGKMDQEEIDALDWEYDPFKGLKVLKGEMDYYYNADDDIQASVLKIELQKQKLAVLKEIVENLKWRHQHIKNILEWKKFVAGG